MMKPIRRLGTVLILLLAVMAAGTLPASADPPGNVVPRPVDIVGVADSLTQDLCDGLSVSYDAQHLAPGAARVYCWNAFAVAPGMVVPKQGCPLVARSAGVRAGIQDLFVNAPVAAGGYPCVDFAMVSRSRQPFDPPYGPGGTAFAQFARDALTWAVRSASYGGSDAPANLTLAQLQAIFTCKVTNWAAVGGKAGIIKVYLPQPGSEDLAAWAKILGITTLGTCVNLAPAADEGTFAGFNSLNAIFIYSIGAYVAQKYHSPACGHAPAAGQNEFGCNQTGVLSLGDIGGVAPLTIAVVPTINPLFPAPFWRTLHVVVRFNNATADHISPKLERIFGARGWICTSLAARADIMNYGFVPIDLCGTTS